MLCKMTGGFLAVRFSWQCFPVAVPEILCSQFAHRISSGLTLSICAARCLRKRKCLPSRFGRLPPPLAALPCGPQPLLFARLLFRVAAKPSRFASLAPRQAAAQLLRSFVSATGGSRSKPTGSARKRPPLPSRGAFSVRCTLSYLFSPMNYQRAAASRTAAAPLGYLFNYSSFSRRW